MLWHDQVHRVSDDFYEVDGFPKKIPVRFVIPSQDGDYWIFYGDQNGKPTLFCFFAQMDF
jgi:hypothetical protein